MTGKLGPEALAEVLAATGADDPAVTVGPTYGEDAAAIDLSGADETLVVAADPLSLAADAVGELAVHVACNDVAASGADPRWLTHTLFLPDADPARRRTVTRQVDETAAELGVAIVGGHTEVLGSLERPLCSMTALGTTDRFVSSGGAAPGDRLLLTKGAGIEATAILATDFREECAAAGVPTDTLDAAAEFLDDVSVVSDAAAVRDHANALHDPTEGGLLTALVETATASGTELAVERDRVPVRPETRACCEALGVDPLATFGSGALLASVPPERVDEATDALEAAGIDAGVIGDVRAGSGGDGRVLVDGERLAEAPRDELYPLWEGE
ncbi:AIR synthase related protein domain protein [Halorubrum aidingense JCM 13560]|uniref:AIR synthase related protein domain protein n=1 Tax=Halorubrum aidingense JCM 13560 TaxID=1230454 RepID=M0PAY2_9EURY|nr:AIR synthase family protein [Halorubrum aidingense]EMA66714.1 AIR synthase related protein domain protein [Halorubrum aidingense JCM 13560]